MCGRVANTQPIKEAALVSLEALIHEADYCPACILVGARHAAATCNREVEAVLMSSTNGLSVGADVQAVHDRYHEVRSWDYKKHRDEWWAEQNQERFIAEGGIYGL
jgi:hypothetical protein